MLKSRLNISYGCIMALAMCAGYVCHSRALDLDTYAASSRMSEGKWVKIKVQDEGMQYLSNEALKEMGFDSPERVHIYGYGGYRLGEALSKSSFIDDLPLQPCVRTPDGIVFYGAGTVRWLVKSGLVTHEQNPYSTGSYYFVSDAPLREGESEAASEVSIPYGSDDKVVKTYTHYLLHEKEISAAGNTGSDLFGEDFRVTNSQTFTFDLPGAADDKVNFNTAFASKASGGAVVTLTAGSEASEKIFMQGTTNAEIHAHVSSKRVSGLQSEPGKGTLTVKYDGSGVTYKAFLDFIECSYERNLKLDDAPLQFCYHVVGGDNIVFSLSGVGDNTMIWDITDPQAPLAVAYEREGSQARFAPCANGLRRYVAFNPTRVKTEPSSVGTVSNQDLHAMEAPDMLIITPKEFKAQADRLAEFHNSHDGMSVAVLTPEVIYNEFSSGVPDVTAYRKLLKMWYDRTYSQPSYGKTAYCLLMGRATYDQRKLSENLRNSTYPRILAWQSTINYNNGNTSFNETSSYVSDNYIAMLNDCKSLSMSSADLNVGVGRMPVKSVNEARSMVDKIIKFVDNPDYGAWRNNVLLLADDGNNAVHAEQTEGVHDRLVANGGEDFQYEKMYIDAYEYGSSSSKKSYPQAKARMLKFLDEGVSLWTYIGHANPTLMTAEDMWTYTDITNMTNRHWPMLYTASCEFVRFDDDAVSGCELMWLHPDNGIIAAIAANRKVYVSSNELISYAFAKNYFLRDADNMPRRLGEVYKDAVNQTYDNNSNKHRYTLVGDPALRVPAPLYSIHVDSLAGVDVNSIEDPAEYPVVPGLSRLKLQGTIRDLNGNQASDFEGRLTATLYDAETVITTHGHATDAKDGKQISYNDRKNKLFVGSFPVSNGKWEATLLVPEDIENNLTPARITLYATSSTASLDAIGSTDHFYINGWDDNAPTDTIAPRVHYAYLNNEAFRPGATVGPDPVFKAKVSDESGINISTSGVGRLLTIIVDNNKVYDNLADYYTTDPLDPTTGTIAYSLTGLGEGEHNLDFLVWDNAGNCTRTGFDFKIAPQSALPDLDIFTDASPAVSSVTFFINSADAVQGLVEVFDLGGRRVWYSDAPRGDGALSTKWNLTDRGGTRVPRGIYLYRATVRDAAGNERKATKKLAVGNP